MGSEKEFQDRIRSAGLRKTEQRLAVFMAVQGTNRHLDVEAIACESRKRLGALSTQAVYDNLGVLVEAGLVRRIQTPGHPARYEARVGDNHHHIVCKKCGSTCDVDCKTGSAPCMEPVANHGFIIEEAEVTFWGVCPQCQ